MVRQAHHPEQSRGTIPNDRNPKFKTIRLRPMDFRFRQGYDGQAAVTLREIKKVSAGRVSRWSLVARLWLVESSKAASESILVYAYMHIY